jgi:hypothetical protein
VKYIRRYVFRCVSGNELNPSEGYTNINDRTPKKASCEIKIDHHKNYSENEKFYLKY